MIVTDVDDLRGTLKRVSEFYYLAVLKILFPELTADAFDIQVADTVADMLKTYTTAQKAEFKKIAANRDTPLS